MTQNKKRLAVQYNLSGEPNSNDYTLTIKNINRSEANQFRALITSLNYKLKSEKNGL